MKWAGRTIPAVIAGAVLWAVLWVGGTAAAGALFPDTLQPGVPLTATAPLLVLILYSVVLAVAAGYTAAAVGRSMVPVYWLAALQFALGIGFEASAWSMTPMWYHLVFLLLIVPMTIWGGTLAAPPADRLAA